MQDFNNCFVTTLEFPVADKPRAVCRFNTLTELQEYVGGDVCFIPVNPGKNSFLICNASKQGTRAVNPSEITVIQTDKNSQIINIIYGPCLVAKIKKAKDGTDIWCSLNIDDVMDIRNYIYPTFK